MPAVTLYSLSGSPPCRSVLMLLEILGLEANIKEVNTLAGEQFNPEYLEKNPLHTIPLLEEGDFLLPDSHAIITYLASKYGADKRATLYPSDLRVRAKVDQMLHFDTSKLFPSFRAVVMAFYRDKATEVPAQLKVDIEEAYGLLEKFLEKSTFLATDHITLADISCVASISTINLVVPIDEKFPKTKEWLNKIQQHDWYQKGNGEGLAMIDGFFKNFLNKS